MLGKLRLANRLELSVGIGFTLIGFFIGSLLIRSTLNNKINLESPQEVSEPAPKPYVSEVSPSRETPIQQTRKKKMLTKHKIRIYPLLPLLPMMNSVVCLRKRRIAWFGKMHILKLLISSRKGMHATDLHAHSFYACFYTLMTWVKGHACLFLLWFVLR